MNQIWIWGVWEVRYWVWGRALSLRDVSYTTVKTQDCVGRGDFSSP